MTQLTGDSVKRFGDQAIAYQTTDILDSRGEKAVARRTVYVYQAPVRLWTGHGGGISGPDLLGFCGQRPCETTLLRAFLAQVLLAGLVAGNALVPISRKISQAICRA